MTRFIKMNVTVLLIFKYKNDTIYKNVCHSLSIKNDTHNLYK